MARPSILMDPSFLWAAESLILQGWSSSFSLTWGTNPKHSNKVLFLLKLAKGILFAAHSVWSVTDSDSFKEKLSFLLYATVFVIKI